jgi:hypothetical protein
MYRPQAPSGLIAFPKLRSSDRGSIGCSWPE